MNTKYLIAASFLTILASPAAWSQNSSREGFERMQTNLQNSQTNLGEYEKNLKVVNANIQEVQKAKKQVLDQQSGIQKQNTSNQESLKKIEAQEKEVTLLLNNEKMALEKEMQQLREMEAMSAKIRENQKKREGYQSDYQLQLGQLAEEKKIWSNRGKVISEQSLDLDKQLRTITAEENEWKTKLQGYQGEVNRWRKEVERQQKINDSYKSLAEVK